MRKIIFSIIVINLFSGCFSSGEPRPELDEIEWIEAMVSFLSHEEFNDMIAVCPHTEMNLDGASYSELSVTAVRAMNRSLSGVGERDITLTDSGLMRVLEIRPIVRMMTDEMVSSLFFRNQESVDLTRILPITGDGYLLENLVMIRPYVLPRNISAFVTISRPGISKNGQFAFFYVHLISNAYYSNTFLYCLHRHDGIMDVTRFALF